MPRSKPVVFIGSSTEGLEVARALQCHLRDFTQCKIWDQGVFGLGEGTLESLIRAAETSDFAILVVTPDDLIECRGERSHAPRDNVIFELGLFIGSLGSRRTFLVFDEDIGVKLPTDLSGITAATYRSKKHPNLKSALSSAAQGIETNIKGSGIRPDRMAQLIPGEWEYEVRGTDGDYQHAGNCTVTLDHLGLKFVGVRTMHTEGGQSREVQLFWQSLWVSPVANNMIRFDYEIGLPSRRARGYVTLYLDPRMSILRGEFCYLAPESQFGTIEFRRRDTNSKP